MRWIPKKTKRQGLMYIKAIVSAVNNLDTEEEIAVTIMDIKNLLCTSNTTTVTPLSHPTVMDCMPLYSSKSPVETYQHSPVCWSSSSSAASTDSPSDLSFYSTLPSPLATTPPTSPTAAPSRRPTARVSQTRTPWTPKEDYLLRQGYAEGLSWAMISFHDLPHRSRGCCWGRFKMLQTKTVEQREWSEAEET